MKRIFQWHTYGEEAFDCGSFVSIIREQIEFVVDDYSLFTYPIDDTEVIVVAEIYNDISDETVDILIAEIAYALESLFGPR